MKTLTRILAAALLPATVLLAACNKDDDGPQQPQDTMFGTFATLASFTKTSATFTVNEGPGTPGISLNSAWNVDTAKVRQGKRYYIYYTNGTDDKPLQPGVINLLAVGNCHQAPVDTLDRRAITPMASSTYFTEFAPTMTGQYVNAYILGAGSAKTFGVYADSATVAADYPDLYLCFEPSVSTSPQTVEYFGSFDASALWNAPTCKGLTLHYELKGTPETLTFKKPNTITPVN